MSRSARRPTMDRARARCLNPGGYTFRKADDGKIPRRCWTCTGCRYWRFCRWFARIDAEADTIPWRRKHTAAFWLPGSDEVRDVQHLLDRLRKATVRTAHKSGYHRPPRYLYVRQAAVLPKGKVLLGDGFLMIYHTDLCLEDALTFFQTRWPHGLVRAYYQRAMLKVIRQCALIAAHTPERVHNVAWSSPIWVTKR